MSLSYTMAQAIVRAIAGNFEYSPDMRWMAQAIIDTDFEAYEVGEPWRYILSGLPYYTDADNLPALLDGA
jgi:hypothetical protein